MFKAVINVYHVKRVPQVGAICSLNMGNRCHPDLAGSCGSKPGRNWVISGHTWVRSGSRGSPGSCCGSHGSRRLCGPLGLVNMIFECYGLLEFWGKCFGPLATNNGCLGL